VRYGATPCPSGISHGRLGSSAFGSLAPRTRVYGASPRHTRRLSRGPTSVAKSEPDCACSGDPLPSDGPLDHRDRCCSCSRLFRHPGQLVAKPSRPLHGRDQLRQPCPLSPLPPPGIRIPACRRHSCPDSPVYRDGGSKWEILAGKVARTLQGPERSKSKKSTEVTQVPGVRFHWDGSQRAGSRS
jgi:hypothetical protein